MATRVIDIAGFVLCGLALVWLLLDARRSASKSVPLGTLLDGLMSTRAPRMTIMLFWWWVGWHFLVTQPL